MTGEGNVDAEQMTLPAEGFAAEKPKRKRRTKAEMEAARAAEAAAKAEKTSAGAKASDEGAVAEKPAEKPKRKRRTKAEMEAARAAEAAAIAAAEAAGIKIPPKKRGRPSKKDKEAREAALAAAAAVAAKMADAAPSAEGGAASKGAGSAPDAQAAGASPAKRKGAKDAGAKNAEAGSRAAGKDADAGKGADAARSADAAKGGAAKNNGSDQRSQSDAQGASQGFSRDGRNNRRNRRNRRNNNNNHQRREIVPSATRDELASLEDDALVARALELSVDPTEYGERDDLVSAVYDALLQSEGFVEVEGILDLMPDGYGFIRTKGYLPGEHDVYVGSSMVRRNGLRKGDHVAGRVRPPRDNEKYPALNTILALNDEPFEGPQHRVKFQNLTPVYPDERLVLEHGKDALTARAIDLVSPIGKGQRGLIVSPPKAGKTTVLKDIAAAISANNPEVHLMCLLVDERPEEVTDMERSINGEVVSSTFDMPADNHIAVAELVIERAKRLVEAGHDVVILLDSITRLARAYNLAQPASGRILSGGVDSTALYPPKRFLGAARNIENGGSLTILGTALVDTGSKMDEVIFEEFKGTGNMELKLDRTLSERRIFPAIDPVASSTRKDELLVDAQEAPLVWGLRRLLANMNNTERAMDMLIKSLRQTETNQEFLIKSARKSNKQGMVV